VEESESDRWLPIVRAGHGRRSDGGKTPRLGSFAALRMTSCVLVGDDPIELRNTALVARVPLLRGPERWKPRARKSPASSVAMSFF